MPTVVARHYATGQPVAVTWRGDAIAEVAPASGAPEAVVAPGLFDIQVNGYLGRDFAAPGSLGEVARALAAHGVARFCPTVCTGSDERMGQALAAIARARREDPSLAEAVPLVHLEGPYLSSEPGARGAHPPEHTRDPDWDHFCRLQERAEGLIRLVTLAPERPGAIAFIARCREAGIAVAIGHTTADAETIAAAVRAGARLSTHLGNGLATPMDRHRNPLWPQLAEERLVASFIADGEHLPREALVAMIRAKGGARGAILVSDAVPEAGLPPGRYPGVAGVPVEVLPSGRIQLAGTPYLAGSGAHLAQCVAFAVRAGAATLPEALDMASIRPAEVLGLPAAGLRPGARADLVLFALGPTGELEVRATVRAGTVVYGELG
jgi:N-acetylglucosamine-6-phosphate deacetylase